MTTTAAWTVILQAPNAAEYNVLLSRVQSFTVPEGWTISTANATQRRITIVRTQWYNTTTLTTVIP